MLKKATYTYTYKKGSFLIRLNGKTTSKITHDHLNVRITRYYHTIQKHPSFINQINNF